MLAEEFAGWLDFLSDAIDLLDDSEKAVLLQATLRLIRHLQVEGRIPVARMCVSCTYFRPYVHDDQTRPHHCVFVDAPFGDTELRIDCGDHRPAADDRAETTWLTISTQGADAL